MDQVENLPGDVFFDQNRKSGNLDSVDEGYYTINWIRMKWINLAEFRLDKRPICMLRTYYHGFSVEPLLGVGSLWSQLTSFWKSGKNNFVLLE